MSTIFKLSIATAILLGMIFYVLASELQSEEPALGYTPSIITVEELEPGVLNDN